MIQSNVINSFMESCHKTFLLVPLVPNILYISLFFYRLLILLFLTLYNLQFGSSLVQNATRRTLIMLLMSWVVVCTERYVCSIIVFIVSIVLYCTVIYCCIFALYLVMLAVILLHVAPWSWRNHISFHCINYVHCRPKLFISINCKFEGINFIHYN